jgi:ComF family protein
MPLAWEHYRMLSNFGAAKFDSARSGCASVARDVHRFCLSLLRTALPQACTLCTAGSGEALLCADCRSEMPRNDPACPRCALPLAAAQTCGACLATPPPFAMTIAPWRYAFPADRLLRAFKYGGHLALADAFAAALAQAIAERCAPLPDCVVPIPLSDARQRMRGFNHAREIARGVALHTGVPLCAGLRRVRDAPPQAGLARAARLRNVRGAFLFDRRLDGQVIAIVDDVMTTGATLGAAALAALHAGAARVDAWVVARTPRPAHPHARDRHEELRTAGTLARD